MANIDVVIENPIPWKIRGQRL